MPWLLTKYAVTALLVVVISEAAKRSDKLGGLIAALPLVTVLTLTWLWAEGQPETKIANHAWYTLWYVLPTLPMFAAFPFLLSRLGFWGAMTASVAITMASFVIFAFIMKRFGIDLL